MSTDQKPQHKKCPSGIDSWCFYQSSLARGKKPGFHKVWVKTPINEEYLPKILPIYQRLASSELLSRKRIPLEINPGNVVAIQCSSFSPSNDAGMSDPGIDGPPKNNVV
ncbi:uncharacterized protein TNCV_3450511 [Trichonephila clavipes]|uniref:Uncharacterized protein n=1 Tax=Trichonephila clavipes TaxID=2585209 RepID=A0A8X7BMA6_TRICX|nr:uncharacterized protein TNCV_3450511 [Trichonephila clavipes]